jgi:peptidoglycan-associated lipoprotein
VQIQERFRSSVAGCENFISDPTNAMSREELIDLNVKFAQEVPTVVNFDFDRSELRPDARSILARQAAWIAQYPDLSFSVFGHTDLVGSADYNFALAKRRADAVVAYLISRGVSAEQLDSIVSFGLTQPIILTPRPEERNRRAVTEVSGFLRPGPRRSLVPISCGLLEQRFLPTYSQCIETIRPGSVPVPPRITPIPGPDTPAPTVTDTSTSYDTGTSSGGASISVDSDGNVTRSAEGRTGPADSPRTEVSATSTADATGTSTGSFATATGRAGTVSACSGDGCD